ncbi:ead/Ea22-like family protein [Citrobacter freundii]|nr:ead/Ea22-like family protein [Citrobacter freundii]MDX7393859.1 ead/Ea22-like family protein [Citrobacter freundii]
MTALNKRAYRADGGDIGSGRLKEIAGNAYGDEEKRWLAQRVLALLDENLQLQRDKDSLEAVAIAMRDDMREAREKLEAAEKRIAELESREMKLPRMAAIYWHLSDASKRRTSEENILDVLEAIDSFRAAGIGVKGE